MATSNLHVRKGSLGVRQVRLLALPSFLASAASTADLEPRRLISCSCATDTFFIVIVPLAKIGPHHLIYYFLVIKSSGTGLKPAAQATIQASFSDSRLKLKFSQQLLGIAVIDFWHCQFLFMA
jgi:hypothetical protein